MVYLQYIIQYILTMYKHWKYYKQKNYYNKQSLDL